MKPYSHLAPSMSKQALSVRPEDPMYMRPVSGLLGRVLGSPMTALTLLSTAPFKPGPDEESQHIKNVLKGLSKDKLLEDHVVNLNDVHPLENLGRVWSNKRTSIGTKLLGSLLSPLGDLQAALGRSDHYNPYADSSTIFTNAPGILAHELGHAKDFNSGDYPGLYALGRMTPLVNLGVIPYQEYAASQNAMKDLSKNKKISDEELAQAGSTLQAGYNSYLGSIANTLTGLPLTLPLAWAGRATGDETSFDAPRRKSKGD